MKSLIRSSLVLFFICTIAAISLGFVNEITKDKILLQRFEAGEKAKQLVLPEATSFENVDFSDFISTEQVNTVALGLADKGKVGFVAFIYPNGYGGSVEVIVGVDSDGYITGVRIGSHTETPGLGDKASKEPFYSQYTGKKSTGELSVVKSGVAGETEINSISGATITSSAVTRAVNEAGKVYEYLKERGLL